MDPIVSENEEVRIIYRPFERIRIGDIVAVYADGCCRIHRVIRYGFDGIVTKGDYSCKEDSPIGEMNYIGYYGRSKFGRLVSFFSSLQNRIYQSYEKRNDELSRKAFCLIIEMNRHINIFAKRLMKNGR